MLPLPLESEKKLVVSWYNFQFFSLKFSQLIEKKKRKFIIDDKIVRKYRQK